MDVMQKQKSYENELRKMYAQVSKKRSKEELSVEGVIEDSEVNKTEFFELNTAAMMQYEKDLVLQKILQSKTRSGILESQQIESKNEIVPFVQENILLKEDIEVVAEDVCEEEIISSTYKELNQDCSILHKIVQKTHSIIEAINPKKKEKTIGFSLQKNNKKRLFTRVKAALAAAFVLGTGAFLYSENRTENDEAFFQPIRSQSSDYENEICSELESIAENSLAKVSVTLDQDKIVQENSAYVDKGDRLLLGKSVLLNEYSNVYMTEQDVYLNENPLTSYYSSDDERVVIGVLVENESGIKKVSADQEDANLKINAMLDNGGEVVDILAANRKCVLADYDGTEVLSMETINTSAEGWYNASAIRPEKVKTLYK